MSPRVESTAFFLLVGACVLVAVCIVILLSRLTSARLSALGNLRDLLAAYPTYVVGAIGVGNEIYSSYKYGTPFNWTGILTLLGISVGTGQLKSGQNATAATAKGIMETTDVILNTMPVGPKTPVPRNPTVTTPEPAPLATPPKPLIPFKDSS